MSERPRAELRVGQRSPLYPQRTCMGRLVSRPFVIGHLLVRPGCGRARWRRSSESVFCGNGVPSAVRRSSSPSASLRMVGRKVRMPKRVNIALIWLINPRLLGDQILVLAVRSPRVLLLDRRDRHHAAMALLAPPPAETDG